MDHDEGGLLQQLQKELDERIGDYGEAFVKLDSRRYTLLFPLSYYFPSLPYAVCSPKDTLFDSASGEWIREKVIENMRRELKQMHHSKINANSQMLLDVFMKSIYQVSLASLLSPSLPLLLLTRND